VPAYLNAMDVLAVPSQTTKNWCEQFGRMVVEAFACGVPVVSSDSGELPFTVGDAGAIVGESDRDGWVRTLEGLLNSSDRREDLAERGRERATSRFAWPLIARRTLEFLAEMAGQPVGPLRVAE
jgi:glycosyltransferase involved in cell wall biosynthesis